MANNLPELGIGMVGYGFIGKVHTYGYKNIPLFYDSPPYKINLVGVCTSREETGRKAMTQAGYNFATTDYRELLKNDNIHIIDCCTPNFLHKDLLIDAIHAGKHIYCDKPLCLSLNEAEVILKEAQAGSGKYQMAFEYRFIPALMKAKQLVEEGFLGTTFHFRCCYLHSGYIDKNRPMSWRLEKEKAGGGALFDLGSHIIDLIGWLLGDYESVFTTTETFIKERPEKKESKKLKKVEVDDLALLQVRMKSGALGTMEFSRLATGTNDEFRIELHGDRGAIYFNSLEPNWVTVYDRTEGGEPIGGRRGFKRIETVQRYPEPARFPGPKFTIGWLRYHIASQYNFLTNIVDGKRASPSFKDGYKVQELMEAAYISAERKRWINLPLQT